MPNLPKQTIPDVHMNAADVKAVLTFYDNYIEHQLGCPTAISPFDSDGAWAHHARSMCQQGVKWCEQSEASDSYHTRVTLLGSARHLLGLVQGLLWDRYVFELPILIAHCERGASLKFTQLVMESSN